VVSQVSSLQRKNEPWNCMWCEEPNAGYTSRNDPATATLADLSADMGSHGLQLTPAAPGPSAAPDTQLLLEARARGANAVVAMRFDCNEIGDIMSEIAAYGTAVTVEPIQQAAAGSAPPAAQ
jgi:hypothetical protein